MKATRINGTWTYYINGERMTRKELEGLTMTPEQVSALSDTELNRAMIWLYYLGFDISYNHHKNKYVDCTRVIDYLGVYNLTLLLVIKNRLDIKPNPYRQATWSARRLIKNRSFSASNKNYLRDP